MISRRAFALAFPALATTMRGLRAAEVDGKWEAAIEGPQGSMVLTFDLNTHGRVQPPRMHETVEGCQQRGGRC